MLAISDRLLDKYYEQRTVIGRADLNLFIDYSLPASKTKTNKMDHDFLCV